MGETRRSVRLMKEHKNTKRVMSEDSPNIFPGSLEMNELEKPSVGMNLPCLDTCGDCCFFYTGIPTSQWHKPDCIRDIKKAVWDTPACNEFIRSRAIKNGVML